MNKYRISIMFAIIVILALYMAGIYEVDDVTNFAITLGALLFSISAAVDTYANEKKIVKVVQFVLDLCAILVILLIPNLKCKGIIQILMSMFDTNVLLLLSLFFTMANQWAVEIKIKDIKNIKSGDKNVK